jgi:NADH dehydrogenase
MTTPEVNVVTGAFSYTGRYIARRLLAKGKAVRTLTGHPDREDPFGGRVRALPYDFERPAALAESLRGATTLYNTYWVRFPHGQASFDKAVDNTRVLIEAAREAGVGRIVHVSVSNASEHSPLPYFRGKGLVESAVMSSSLSYAIVRPTLVFGTEDVLINNIAWLLRRFPLFAVPGSGDYRLQPVFADDVAEIAVNAAHRDESTVLDAAGPETYTFDELVRLIAGSIRSKARIVHLRPGPALVLAGLIGRFVNDVVLTRGEVEGLMSNLLVSDAPPAGQTRLSDWLDQNADSVGTRYASELKRHYR